MQENVALMIDTIRLEWLCKNKSLRFSHFPLKFDEIALRSLQINCRAKEKTFIYVHTYTYSCVSVT